MDLEIQLTFGELLGIITLFLSLMGNCFQLYIQRLYGHTIYNGLVGAFNSVGWLLARCMNKTQELERRIKSENGSEHASLKEFREFSVDAEFSLRGLHEQLVAVAKTLGTRDERWQAGEFGYTPEEIEKIRRAFTEKVSQF